MRYFLNETPEVVFALWTGIAALAFGALMFIGIIVMHWVVARRERTHMQSLQRWREILGRAIGGDTDNLPQLQPNEVPEFAEVWNDLHESMPEGHALLRRVGTKIELSAAARQVLHKSHHQRAMAISALGHQGDVNDFDVIEPFLSDTSPIISLCAARALSQIDAPKSMALFVPALLQRNDWPDGTIASIFKENHSASAIKALSSAILRVNDNTAARLIRFLADTDAQRASPVIRHFLDALVDDHVTSTCLQVVSDRADLARIRQFIHHPRWHVRMHAASALGRLGDHSDEKRLTPLLSDPQWWVRYRTAQAIRALPGVKAQEFDHLGQAQSDSFAQQIVRQVLAEPARKGAA